MTNKRVPNRLIHELSPYLQQHAYNPVDWWPWCDEAFDRAEAENKPVFLSIGYSTCHWCHVMERESFEDEEVAAFLNQHFISIKVDREERPDVDHVYMSACLAMTGSGGWPLTVFLTPGRKPFFAGTYFPKNDSYGRMGFLRLLKKISLLWQQQTESLVQSAEDLTRLIREQAGASEEEPVDKDISQLPKQAAAQLLKTLDKKWGGFGTAPKFPAAHNLMFLMRMGRGEPVDSPVWTAVQKTLDGMAAGGIRDHIGGGFCRYSTDQRWLVPHFEKMLYDNALLLMAYTEAYQKTERWEYREVACGIADFIQREMTSPEGGFYTALDADSEGEEGLFYLWTPQEVIQVLGSEDGVLFCSLYDITPEGNFEGRSIPNLIGKNIEKELFFVRPCIQKLYAHRRKRTAPFLDTKIMLSNNSLMVAALAMGAVTFDRPRWLKMAETAMQFILENLVSGNRIASVWKDGKTTGTATLDGLAYAVWALIELYEATFAPHWLRKAVELNQKMLDQFRAEGGGLYFSPDQGDLPVRAVNPQDGAVPSGQSVAAHNLIRLSRLTGESSLENRAKDLLDSLASSAAAAPTAFTWLLAAADYLADGGTDVVLAEGEGLSELLAQFKGFYPYTTRSVCGKDYPGLSDIASFTRHMAPQEGKAAAYLCKNGSCVKPVTQKDQLKELLNYQV